MAGYLDSSFEARFTNADESYRQLASRLLTLTGTSVHLYGFGDNVAPIPGPGGAALLSELVKQGFYSHGNTRLEQVPDKFIGDWCHFVAAELFKATDADRQDVTIDFKLSA